MTQQLTEQKEQTYTQAQLDLIKRTVALGATSDELLMFLHVAKKSHLDPFMRQIHFVKRGGKATIQVGIDGFRTIADRTGAYAGNDEPVYEYEQTDPLMTKKLVKATVTVYKFVAGQRCAFTASALWDEYKPQAGQDFMWTKMPHVMLGKVAETIALRKAFPNDLSGLYSQEEMAQAGANPPQDDQTPIQPPIVQSEVFSDELPVIDSETPATSITEDAPPAVQQVFPEAVVEPIVEGPAKAKLRAQWGN